MRFSLRHIILVFGIIITIASSLYFGISLENYRSFFYFGILIAGGAFIIILFSKEKIKGKLSWIGVIIVSIIIQVLTQPLLIKASYKIFISEHSELLEKVNHVLLSKNTNLYLVTDNTRKSINGLTDFSVQDSLMISDFFQQTGIKLIVKDREKIYYRTTGIAENSKGIYYLFSEQSYGKHYKKIGNFWY